MEIINITGIEDKIYFEKLKNGLEVYMFPMLNRNEASAIFVTRYGGKDVEFIPYNKSSMIKIREGVAHFLEHRLCTNKDGLDAFDFYAKSGAKFNACTHHKMTGYYFSCTTNFISNLIFLMNLVQEPLFKKEDIEKEKGIIEQEVNMYASDPGFCLFEEYLKNIFCVHPVRSKLGGSVEDVMSVNKKVLETCYHTFYHPSNIFLVVTGNFDVDEVLDVIRRNQLSKKFSSTKKIVKKEYDEPNRVNKEVGELRFPIDIPKMKFNIKIPLTNLEKIPNYDLYIDTIFRVVFGPTSLFVEQMKEKGYITNNYGIYFEKIDNHYIVTADADGHYLDEIQKEIRKTIKKLEVNEEELERYKKCYIKSEIMAYENVISAREYIKYMLIEYGKIMNNEIGRIKSLNIEELNKVISALDLTNISVTVLKPKKDL